MGCWVLGLQALPSCAFPLSIWMLQRLLAACLWMCFPLSFPQIMFTFSSQLRSPKPWWMLVWISKQWYNKTLFRGNKVSAGSSFLLGITFSQGHLRRWDWRGLDHSSVKLEMWSPWVIRGVNIRQFEVEKHSITYPGSVKTPFFHSCDGSASPCCDLKVITYSVNVWQSNSKVKPAW